MKYDPHKSRECYLKWRHGERERYPDLSEGTRGVFLTYLDDLERGLNLAPGTKKGPRSYVRIKTVMYRLGLIGRHLRRLHGVDSVLEVSEEQLHDLFGAMRSGRLPRKCGNGPYRSAGDYVKVFKAFWHWHMRTARKRGEAIEDICVDLDTQCEKPPWVYLNLRDVERLGRQATFKYRVLMFFLFDSGVRSPTELSNLKRSDFSEDCSQLRVRDEISKTVGRTIKLLLSQQLVQDYVEAEGFGPEDYPFRVSPGATNRYLRRLAARVLGADVTKAGSRYDELSLYDFRHSSACYWLPRYKQESGLKYRFGWKRSSMVHYYTGLLGMRDTITQDDLITDVDPQTAEVSQLTREKRMLEERFAAMSNQMLEMQKQVRTLAKQLSGGNYEESTTRIESGPASDLYRALDVTSCGQGGR